MKGLAEGIIIFSFPNFNINIFLRRCVLWTACIWIAREILGLWDYLQCDSPILARTRVWVWRLFGSSTHQYFAIILQKGKKKESLTMWFFRILMRYRRKRVMAGKKYKYFVQCMLKLRMPDAQTHTQCTHTFSFSTCKMVHQTHFGENKTFAKRKQVIDSVSQLHNKILLKTSVQICRFFFPFHPLPVQPNDSDNLR